MLVAALWGCPNERPGSDFDRDGLTDETEDPNDDFLFDPGETDFLNVDTDADGLCDGQPDSPLPNCSRCDDCDNDGIWEPCLGETDPLNDDTDNDAVPDAQDPAPLDGIDCSGGAVERAYGSSLPPGEPFPARPTPTPTPAPFPTSTPGPPPTVPTEFAPFLTPTPTPAP